MNFIRIGSENFSSKDRSSDSSTLIDKGNVWLCMQLYGNGKMNPMDFFSKLIAFFCHAINQYFPEAVFYGQCFGKRPIQSQKMSFHSAVTPGQIPLLKD